MSLVAVEVVINDAAALSELRTLGTEMEKTATKGGDTFEAASGRMGKAFSGLGNLAASYGLPLQGVFDSIANKMDEAKSKGEGFKGTLQSISGLAAGAAAAGVGAVAGESIHLAEGYEEVRLQLEAAMKSSGQSMDQWGGKIKDAEGKMSQLGFSSTEVDGALSKGVVATQSTGKSLQLLGVAADLARYKHVDLSTAMTAVSRASEGQTKALKALGIDLPVAAGGALKVQNAQDALTKSQDAATAYLTKNGDALNVNSKYHAEYEKLLTATESAQKKLSDTQNAGTEIVDALSQRLGGQATAATKGFHGEMTVAKAQLENVSITIGQKLMPVIAKLATLFAGFIKFVMDHKEVLVALALIVGTLLTVATYSWAASLFAADGALAPLAGTVGLVVLAILALIVIVIVLYENWGTIWNFIKQIATEAWHFLFDNVIKPIENAFTDAWNAIKNAFSAVFNWLLENWPLVLEIITGPIGIAVGFIIDNWNGIVNFFWGMVDTIGNIFDQIGQSIYDAFEWAVNGVIGFLNTLIRAFDDVAGWVPGVPNIPQIPRLAQGGPVQAGMPYIVGDGNGGTPELFVPNQSGRVLPNSAVGKGGNNIVVNVTSPSDPYQIAAEVSWIMKTKVA